MPAPYPQEPQDAIDQCDNDAVFMTKMTALGLTLSPSKTASQTLEIFINWIFPYWHTIPAAYAQAMAGNDAWQEFVDYWNNGGSLNVADFGHEL